MPPCHGGGRGFKSRQGRSERRALFGGPFVSVAASMVSRGSVAQLVERTTENREVTGSTPVGATGTLVWLLRTGVLLFPDAARPGTPLSLMRSRATISRTPVQVRDLGAPAAPHGRPGAATARHAKATPRFAADRPSAAASPVLVATRDAPEPIFWAMVRAKSHGTTASRKRRCPQPLARLRTDLHGRFRLDPILQAGPRHSAGYVGQGEVGLDNHPPSTTTRTPQTQTWRDETHPPGRAGPQPQAGSGRGQGRSGVVTRPRFHSPDWSTR